MGSAGNRFRQSPPSLLVQSLYSFSAKEKGSFTRRDWILGKRVEIKFPNLSDFAMRGGEKERERERREEGHFNTMQLNTRDLELTKYCYRNIGRLNIRRLTSCNRFHLVQLLVLLVPTSSPTHCTSLPRLDYRPTHPRTVLVPCCTGQRQIRTLKKLLTKMSKSIRNGSKRNRRLRDCGNSASTYSIRVVEKVLYHRQLNVGSY